MTYRDHLRDDKRFRALNRTPENRPDLPVRPSAMTTPAPTEELDFTLADVVRLPAIPDPGGDVIDIRSL